MAKARIKFSIFIAAVLIGVPIIALGVALLMQFVTAFQQGADPASIFRGHKLIIPDPADARWVTDAAYEGAIPTQAENEEILSAYWSAWEALRRAQLTGDTADLATYWAGAAYRHALAGIDPKKSIELTHRGHALRLTFFSDDSSVVAFEDEGFSLEETLNKQLVHVGASASVVMTLDTGFWRIRTVRFSYH